MSGTSQRYAFNEIVAMLERLTEDPSMPAAQLGEARWWLEKHAKGSPAQELLERAAHHAMVAKACFEQLEQPLTDIARAREGDDSDEDAAEHVRNWSPKGERMALKLTADEIARICHEANRVYCSILGDHSQLPWDDAPQWQRSSAIAGVEAKLDNPEITPEQSHEGWMRHKAAEGWVYGPEKDPERKTHPCMLPYAQLPEEQRRKDALFNSIVDALR